jgi:hypothetical protein
MGLQTSNKRGRNYNKMLYFSFLYIIIFVIMFSVCLLSVILTHLYGTANLTETTSGRVKHTKVLKIIRIKQMFAPT